MWVNILLMIILCAVIGWFVHKLMGPGNHGTGLLHYTFIGACGYGIAVLVEQIAGYTPESPIGIIAEIVLCACVAELIIRWIKRRLWIRQIHKMGAYVLSDFDGEMTIVTDKPAQQGASE